LSYRIIVERPAERYLRRRVVPIYDERIRRAIDDLADNPRPTGSRNVRGRESRRIRVGDYRIIYEIDDEERVVDVLQVGHRRDVYR
jgi:mRNA interferase RelE/StbE